jgi:Tfp pilus assembly protein PilF
MVLALGWWTCGFGQESGHEHGFSDGLGTVEFNTSCDAAVRTQFNRGLALMHSFQFERATAEFHGVFAHDPNCAISWWGIALSDWGNPFAAGLKSPAQIAAGRAAVQQARAAGAKTERERAYVDAVAQLYGDGDQRARQLRYERAMETLSGAHSEDVEARIFYALALAAAADPADKSYAKQLKAGAILEALWVKYPDHPGLAHYIIHAYDVPPLAARALPAAHRYSEIAPAAPHALHMPSHTFTRVGDWRASVKANVASATSAREARQPAEELHADDYLAYAYLQMGEDNAAREVAEAAAGTFAHYDPRTAINGAASPAAAYFAHAAIPARYCMERHDWKCAQVLEAYASPYPYADALTWTARGLGAARRKDFRAARQALDELGQLRDRLFAAKESYWANQVEIERREVAARLAFAEGRTQEAVAIMREVASMEDGTEKNVITPGPLTPAHELLGEMLLELDKPTEALVEFERNLAKEPNRFWSLYRAAEAAKLMGDYAASRGYFRKLLAVVNAEDPARKEVAEARAEVQ